MNARIEKAVLPLLVGASRDTLMNFLRALPTGDELTVGDISCGVCGNSVGYTPTGVRDLEDVRDVILREAGRR